MKSNKFLSVFLVGIMVLLCVGLAQAAIDVSSLDANGKITVDVNYGNLDEPDDGKDTMTLSPVTLTFQNTDVVPVNGVALAMNNVATGYTAVLSVNTIDLAAAGAAGDSVTVTLTLTVPLDADAEGDEEGLVHNVGTLNVNGVDYTVDTSVKSMLEIDKIKVTVDDKSEGTVDEDGDNIKNVRPGSIVELKFTVKNNFDKDYSDGDMDDVEVTMEFADEDDEDDYDDSIDEEESFSLDAGDEEEFTFTFEVPATADDKDYDLEITLEGESDNGATHTITWIIILKINRERDDVQLERAELTKTTLKCGESTTLNVKMTNFGSNDQEEASLNVYNAALGLSSNFINIYLDENPDDRENSYSKTINIVVPESVTAGTFDIEVRAYIDGDEEVDHQLVRLIVDGCSLEEEEENLTTGVTGTAGEKDGETTTTEGQGQYLETTETSFGQSTGVLVLMGAVALLLVILIVVVIVFLVKKK